MARDKKISCALAYYLKSDKFAVVSTDAVKDFEEPLQKKVFIQNSIYYLVKEDKTEEEIHIIALGSEYTCLFILFNYQV